MKLLPFLIFFISNNLFSMTPCQKQLELKYGGIKIVKNTYAKSFKSRVFNGVRYLKLKNKEYLFVTSKIKENRKICPKAIILKSELSKVISSSTTHIPFLKELEVLSKLKGFSGIKYIYNKEVRKKIEQGNILNLGFPVKIEQILKIRPQVFITYTNSSPDSCKKLKGFNIYCIEITEFDEEHPLGRAEWIKVFGIIFNKLKEANEIFKNIEKNYLFIKNKKKKNFPKVVIGELVEGHWFAPGGKSYLAKLIKDAGGDYVFSYHKSKQTQKIKIEKTLSLFNEKEVKFWLPQNNFKNKDQIFKLNKKYSILNTLKRKYIYNNSLKISKMGGNDYYESAVLRPDLLLRDLSKIFYPLSYNNHSFIWYQKI